MIAKNKKCLLCGKEIEGCSCKESWRNIACCPEHFVEYVQRQGEVESMHILFRIETNSHATDDIIDYDFDKDEFKGETRTYKMEDIFAFIIPKDEMQNILHKKDKKKKII